MIILFPRTFSFSLYLGFSFQKQQLFSETAIRLQDTVDRMIFESNKNIDALVIENKANTEEFLNVVTMIECGNLDTSSSNSSSPGDSILHDGENLLELFAGPQPSKFGRVLARKLFGSHQECKLMTESIGKPGPQRSPCDVTLRDKFEGLFFSLALPVSKCFNCRIEKPLEYRPFDIHIRYSVTEVVRRKYPRAPNYALADAVKGANQMGLEFRREYMAEKCEENSIVKTLY